MSEIPKEIQDWFERIVKENLAVSKGAARDKVLYKAKHTGLVMMAGKNIVENSPEFEWNKKQAMVICLLHDVGRFPQVLLNSYSDINTGIDHASLGLKMMAEQKFNWKEWDLDGEVIFEAIKWHNQKDYLGDNLYAKFIRDADKNALFGDYQELEDYVFLEKEKNTRIDEKIWEKLEKRESIGNEMVISSAEGIVNYAAWLWNLNLRYSRKLAVESKIIENLLKSLKKNGNGSEDIKRLGKNLEDFRLFATTI